MMMLRKGFLRLSCLLVVSKFNLFLLFISPGFLRVWQLVNQ